MVVETKMPMYHVNKPYFCKPFIIANSNVRVPSYVARSVEIDKMFRENRDPLRERLISIEHLVATVDIWTSYWKSFVGMIVHGIDSKTI